MLKQFHSKPSGSTPEYWVGEWESSSSSVPAAFTGADPLRPFFDKYLSREHPNLEGGCGPAHWLAFWQARGFSMVGLDFAAQTLARVKRSEPDLPLVVGNVNQLPFADQSLGFYYSGGVVEHFEAGPYEALSEARRVLRRDGILMISVPYLSPLRRLRHASGRSSSGDLRAISVDRHAREERPRVPGEFYQYVYADREFRSLLTQSGFTVMESHGVYLLHGLLFEGLLPRFLQGRSATTSSASPSAGGATASAGEGGVRRLAKRLLVEEQSNGALLPLAPVLMLARELFANMRLFICRPS
jgi:SAM-dependent methyltransferase